MRRGILIAAAGIAIGVAGTAGAGSLTRAGDSKLQAHDAVQPAAPTHSRAIGNVVARSIDGTLAPHALTTMSVQCNPGEFITGGGGFAKGTIDVGDAIQSSAPDLTNFGWFVQIYNAGADPEPATVYVLCGT